MKIRNKVKIAITEEKIPAYFYSFSDDNSLDDEHILIEIPALNGQPSSIPLLRIHSECLTGDIFASTRCDCGKQLEEGIKMASKEGGYIAYLRQEGRGIGLYNKLDAYRLQDAGFDTYEANEKLGFSKDSRKFDMVAKMLQALSIDEVDLLTNNPVKLNSLISNGITVKKRISTSKFQNMDNVSYLKTKNIKAHHEFGKLVEV